MHIVAIFVDADVAAAAAAAADFMSRKTRNVKQNGSKETKTERNGCMIAHEKKQSP